jgi:hypothetical protein
MADDKFILPATFAKDIALTTQKVYKGKLNKLAKEGFDTVDKLKSDSKNVIATIKKLTGDDDTEKTRHNRRYYLSAIFWVKKFPKRNAYYTFWQKCVPLKDISTNDDWLKKKDYDLQ